MAIKLVIFDLDGTLVDAYKAISRSFNFAMRKTHSALQSDLVIRRAVGLGDSNLLAPFVEKDKLKNALRLYRKHHKTSLLKYTRLLKGAGSVLRYLKKKNYLMAVASNRPTYFSRIIIRKLKLDKYFSYVLCADKLKQGKPHPGILRKITAKLKVAPSQAIYVGDMPIDAEAGRRAKIKAVIVTTGSGTISQIRKEHPFRIIKTISSLKKLL